MPKKNPVPKLPPLLGRKLYKTGQTRGADDDVIYQNRVSRSSTVLIPYATWPQCRTPSPSEAAYENGFIVLISPDYYFLNRTIAEDLLEQGLALGKNALVFYETRAQWTAHNPDALDWQPAKNRRAPLGGQYVARIAGTTALGGVGGKINRGFTETAMKGAGIRVYEYASEVTNAQCRSQLEAIFWLCNDALAVAMSNGMTQEDAERRKAACLAQCQQASLLDVAKLSHARIINAAGKTVCPLCLEELSAQGFFNRMEQAEGRAVHDLTITQLNLFHIHELRIGVTNHRPYNLGLGHHHCNVVVKDSGIVETLQWMKKVIERNTVDGHLPPENASNIAN
ncbi:MAG: BstXI family restriction endonuclease [Gemmatimonadaceae bacterium]